MYLETSSEVKPERVDYYRHDNFQNIYQPFNE